MNGGPESTTDVWQKWRLPGRLGAGACLDGGHKCVEVGGGVAGQGGDDGVLGHPRLAQQVAWGVVGGRGVVGAAWLSEHTHQGWYRGTTAAPSTCGSRPPQPTWFCQVHLPHRRPVVARLLVAQLVDGAAAQVQQAAGGDWVGGGEWGGEMGERAAAELRREPLPCSAALSATKAPLKQKHPGCPNQPAADRLAPRHTCVQVLHPNVGRQGLPPTLHLHPDGTAHCMWYGAGLVQSGLSALS
jgi:hypothetical protein